MWYLDDGTIVGDLTALNSVACRLQEQLATIGFRNQNWESSSSPGGRKYVQIFLDATLVKIGTFCDAVVGLGNAQNGAALL